MRLPCGGLRYSRPPGGIWTRAMYFDPFNPEELSSAWKLSCGWRAPGEPLSRRDYSTRLTILGERRKRHLAHPRTRSLTAQGTTLCLAQDLFGLMDQFSGHRQRASQWLLRHLRAHPLNGQTPAPLPLKTFRRQASGNRSSLVSLSRRRRTGL